jgi:hypothetical protein
MGSPFTESLAQALPLAVLLALAWAGPAGAQGLPRFAAEGAATYWVDQNDPRADDRNPGTEELPWKTIGRAARIHSLKPGDAVIVRSGVYRESVRPSAGGTNSEARITYAAYPGETVVITGADPLNDGWEWVDGAWRHAWTTPLTAYGKEEFRREMVIVDGRVLRPVYRRADLKLGTFFVEGSDRRPSAIHLLPAAETSLRNRSVEVALRHPLFSPEGKSCGDESQPGWLRVTGFTFRHAANRAQWGAVCAGSEGSLFEDNLVEWTNGLGIDVSGRDHVFRRNRSLDNGQMGFGGSCEGCLLAENESSRNNWKGHDPFWEAGGGKFVRTRNTVVTHHTAADNDGPGIWFDIHNEGNTIEHSRFTGNRVAGILLELATRATLVRGNVVLRTRWVGWSGSGLLAQAASHNVIVGNTFAYNEGSGVWIRLDPERRASDGHNLIYNNLFVRNANTSEGDAREISISGRDLAHARTNRLDGNAYWQHPGSMRVSTFYFQPDSSHRANFRDNDLVRWQQLTGSDRNAVMLRTEGDRPAALLAFTRGSSDTRTDFASQANERTHFASPYGAPKRLKDLSIWNLPIGTDDLGVAVPLPLMDDSMTHGFPPSTPTQ